MRALLPLLALAGCLAPQPLAYDDFEEEHDGWVVLDLRLDAAQVRVGELPAFDVRADALRLIVERNGTEDHGGFRLVSPARAEWSARTVASVAAPEPGRWRVEPAAAQADLAAYRVRILY